MNQNVTSNPQEIETPGRAEWLAERRKGLGASDVPAALGLSPFKSKYQLWAEKCNLLADEDLAAENEAVEWGIRLETPILQGFAQRTGRRVEIPPRPIINVHPELPYLRCTLDARQWAEGRDTPGDAQAKSTSAYLSHEWDKGATPLNYQVQVQAELYVTGLQWGSIICLIGGQRLVYRDVEANTGFMEAALPHLREFWERVLNRDPPEVDGSEITARVLKLLHPNDDGSTAQLPGDAADWHRERMEAIQAIKDAEQRRQLAENRLRAAIGSSTYGQIPGGPYYSLKTQERRESVQVHAATSYRVLRTSKKGPQ